MENRRICFVNGYGGRIIAKDSKFFIFRSSPKMCIRDSSVDVAVGGGESVGLGTLLGHLYAVAHHVVAACVQTGKQAVPVLSLIHI